jgi:hypothetical protein
MGFPPVTPATSPSRTEKVAERVCLVCGGSLKGRRKDARCCSASCRAEQSRIRAIIDGTYAGPYRSLAERLSKRKSSRPLAFPLGTVENDSEAHTGSLRPLARLMQGQPERDGGLPSP